MRKRDLAKIVKGMYSVSLSKNLAEFDLDELIKPGDFVTFIAKSLPNDRIRSTTSFIFVGKDRDKYIFLYPGVSVNPLDASNEYIGDYIETYTEEHLMKCYSHLYLTRLANDGRFLY